MIRHALVSILLVLCVATAPMAKMREPAADRISSPFVTIRILHLNDVHGHLLPEPDLRAETVPAPLFGGAASLATAVRQFRAEPVFGKPADIVLFFDAGDFFQGTPEGNLTRGESVVDLYKRLGLTAQAAGNHDFDFGPETLRRLAGLADWPILAANVRSDSPDFPIRQNAFFRHEPTGLRIGVFGLITDDMASVTTAEARRGFAFEPSIAAARRQVTMIKPSAALVIGITHVGAAQDRAIADQVPGIHVIVGGHSHTSLSPYYKSDTTGAIVVQAGSYLRELGVLDLLFNMQTRKIVRANSRLIPLYRSEFSADPEIDAWVGRIAAQVGGLLDAQIAVSDSNYLRASDTECVPGNLMTDAMRWSTRADAAFQNSYGIRADLPKGPITLRTLFTMMPFDNTIVSMTLSGAEVLDILEQSATMDRGFLQMSGVRMVVDLTRPSGERVLSAEIAGTPIDFARDYRIATNSFLAGGGDLFDTFVIGADRKDDGVNMRDAVRDYIQSTTSSASGVFSGRIEGRIVRQGAGAPVARAPR